MSFTNVFRKSKMFFEKFLSAFERQSCPGLPPSDLSDESGWSAVSSNSVRLPAQAPGGASHESALLCTQHCVSHLVRHFVAAFGTSSRKLLRKVAANVAGQG